ncbi:MAG: type II toxin-antitoxin system HicA family toxin [Proteobacteria bacterium]|nr:type II toxin-antitoxin system HicA family toxin [Pseudomonadota bacterium]
MKRKHQNTLGAIFAHPISGNLKWNDVVAMLKALGADVDESREGSRVGILLNDNAIIQHRPHPSPNMDKGAIASLKKFLVSCGVRP